MFHTLPASRAAAIIKGHSSTLNAWVDGLFAARDKQEAADYLQAICSALGVMSPLNEKKLPRVSGIQRLLTRVAHHVAPQKLAA